MRENLKALLPSFLACITTAIILHQLSNLPREPTNFLLAALQIVVTSSCCQVVEALGTEYNRDVIKSKVLNILQLNKWPTDIRTASQAIHLDPDLLLYANCTECCALYPLDSHGQYPQLCTHRETQGSEPCGNHLTAVSNEDGPPRVIKLFGYQSMKAWLGRLLSRPDIEKVIAETTSQRRQPVFSRITKLWAPGPIKDIWDADVFRNFKGPDGRQWLDAPPTEARLIFSLFVDWFNPFGNKAAGKSASVGAIYMVCMNLPIQLRYRTENVYLVGVIPGPHEPSIHHINHFLRPLIDELLSFWHTGIFFSRTADYLCGRLVRAAVIPLICDLPALRKIGGFAHFSSSEGACSHCLLSKDELDNFDIKSFRRRDWAEHIRRALEWLHAPSEKAREKHWEVNRIRWSELLRLPYWNPTQFPIVDTMHNLFQNDLPHHCRTVLGMTDKSSKPPFEPHDSTRQAAELQHGINGIQSLSVTALNRLRRGYVVAFAMANNIETFAPDGKTKNTTKRAYSQAIIDWVQCLNKHCPMHTH